MIDCPSIININSLIDINCYRLLSIIDLINCSVPDNFIPISKNKLGHKTLPESKMVERDVSLIALILCFFPSLLSFELVLFFSEPN